MKVLPQGFFLLLLFLLFCAVLVNNTIYLCTESNPSPLTSSLPYLLDVIFFVIFFPLTGFVMYTLFSISLSVYLIFVVAPKHGQTNILIYIAICSLIGSLSVMACKGLSIAIKLTFLGTTQIFNPLAWFFLVAVAFCIAIQMNYLNKALDIFNTSIVTPIYYVMFTTLTITASAILFQEWKMQSSSSKDLVGALCGFMTIISGVFLLHAFKDINIELLDILSQTTRPRDLSNREGVRVGDMAVPQETATGIPLLSGPQLSDSAAGLVGECSLSSEEKGEP